MKVQISTLLCIGLPALVCADARAQNLQAYDAFDYTGTLDGQDGGAGWAGPWVGVVNQAPGIHSYWAFENDVMDSGPAAAHGTLVSGTFSNDTPPALSHSTASLSLNGGTRDYVDLSAHVALFENFRVGGFSCWIKQPAGQGGANTVIAASDSTDASREMRIIVEGSVVIYNVRGDVNTWALTSNPTAAPNGVATGTAVNDGNWHHVAVSVGPNDVAKIWIDGVLEGQDRQGLFRHVHTLNTMGIGRNVDNTVPTPPNPPGQWFYTGLIDDLAFFSSELTDTDVAALFGGAQPSTIVGTPPLPGPFLGGANLDNPAFRTFDFVPSGDSVGDLFGARAHRFLEQIVDLRLDATYYISALLRREDQMGVPTTSGLIELSNGGAIRGWFGWDASGYFVCGLNGESVSLIPMTNATTYFCVMRIDAVASGNDTASLKVYGPNDTVHDTDANFVGVGTGALEWAASDSGGSNSDNHHVLITQREIGSLMLVDELRIGTTWESVTSLGYGDGCLGGRIGQSSRPVLGSTNYRVTLSGVRAGQGAAMSIGFDRDMWAGLPLPLDLAVLGAPGCFFLASQDIAIPTTTDGAGNASLPIYISPTPGTYDLRPFAQWTFADLGGPNPLPIGTSNALELRIER